MKLLPILSALSLVISGFVVKAGPTRTYRRRQASLPGFVRSEGGDFKVDGKPFYFVGTTAYWLTQLNTNEDIVKTLTDIQRRGIKVVRTWAFSEVVGSSAPPAYGTYITLWNNGVPTYNEAGLQRLDFIISTAESLGLKIQMVLTNNWAPDRSMNATSPLPRGYFSNDYGGMDTYVQQIAPGSTHDAFYTNEAVVAAYKQYIDKIVLRYTNSAAVFTWEIANDPRCGGAGNFVSGPNCTPQTITRWSGDIANHIKMRDPNHMVASGDAGFYCLLDHTDPTKCQKLNPVPTPTAQPSNVPRSKRNPKKGLPKRKGPLTKKQLLAERVAKERAFLRAARSELIKTNGISANSIRIRGKWAGPVDIPFKPKYLGRRQDGADTEFGSSFDGSQGVDTEDIMGNANIDFSSFQFFPDQNTYSADDKHGSSNGQSSSSGTGGTNYQETVNLGKEWIELHANSANTYGKPVSLNGFGIVGKDSQNYYQPFNSTEVGTDTDQAVATTNQQAQAYDDWLTTAIKVGINGITQYQWGQTGLESQSGSVVDDSNDYHKPDGSDSSSGYSPDDGYAVYSEQAKQVLQSAANQQNQKSGQA